MALRNAAPSPPQFSDSLHRLKKESRRTTDFPSGQAYEDGECEHRGDYAQEADPVVGGNCGRNGGHETAEVRHVRRSGGGRGLRGGGTRKSVGGISLGRPHSIRYQHPPVGDCSPGQGGVAQHGETRGETFHGEIDR